MVSHFFGNTNSALIYSRPQPTLPDNLHQAGKITGPVILQVNNVQNISAPKINPYSQTAPRMLLVTVTDGKKKVQMLEFSKASCLSVDTMPGTKIHIAKSLRIQDGLIELEDKAIRVMGGEVDKLVEKWIVERDSMNDEFRIRTFEQGGPPPFIPFEKRNYKDNKEKVKHEDLSGRRVLNKDVEGKEEMDDEFEAEREKQLADIDAVRYNYVPFVSI